MPVPVVLTAHDYALVCQLRTLYRPAGGRCSGPGPRCVPCGARSYGWARSSLMAPATSVGRRRLHPAAVITLSAHVADTLRPFVDEPIDVCGGLLPHIEPADVVGLPSEPFALFAGDPGAHKGFDVLVKAWRTLEIPLVVATTRAKPDGVLAMSLDRRQMPTAWARAAVAVVPSVWDEPFGMVAMEALAAGTPVVASRVGALPEIVRDGVDGVLVPPGDADALAAGVRTVLADRVRFAEAARDGARRFAADDVVRRLDAVYQRVLQAAVR